MVERVMVAIKTRDLAYKTKVYLDAAARGELVVVSRPRNENVVVLSVEKYNMLQEAAEVGLPLIEKRARKQQRKLEAQVAQS